MKKAKKQGIIVRTREKIQDNYMKYNSPCADTAGSAGESLRKKGGTSMRKRNKVVSLLLAGCMAAGLLAGCGSSGEAQVATAGCPRKARSAGARQLPCF